MFEGVFGTGRCCDFGLFLGTDETPERPEDLSGVFCGSVVVLLEAAGRTEARGGGNGEIDTADMLA